MRKAVSAILVILAFAGVASAQDLGSILGKVGSQYAKGYVAPAVDAFGADLNSGLFHSAKVGGILPFGLSLYVGVQVPTSIIPSSEKNFSMSYIDTVSFRRTIGSNVFDIKVPATFTVNNAPTVFGDKNTIGEATFNAQKDTTISIGGGVSQTFALDSTGTISTVAGLQALILNSLAPMPIPQIGIGSIFGTDIMVRFLPKTKILNVGSAQMVGFAIRHSVSQYIPLVPIDIAVQLGWQNLSVYDSAGTKMLTESAVAANLEVSKTFAIVTLYGGLQVESSSADVNYTFTPTPSVADPNPQSIPISFSVKGKNNVRGLLGLDFGFGPLTVNLDYSVGAVNVATLGIGVGI